MSLEGICNHTFLVADVSPNGDEAGYKRPGWNRRLAATTPSGRFPKDGPKQESDLHAFTFPGPLVFPGDDLACDPSYPPQSLRSWASLKERNKVTRYRKTVYVARPPSISEEVSFMSTWKEPVGLENKKGMQSASHSSPQPPQLHDILEHLRAFYYGFQVKEYTPTLWFHPWETPQKKNKNKKRKLDIPTSSIALKEGPSPSYTQIRTRRSPDGVFAHQLNLNDLLDAAIQILPDDAYALLLLVDHDLYEDEEDDFCCGRAYGGSRVAVVSSARYNPVLHEADGLDRTHMWPASHCRHYMSSQFESENGPMRSFNGLDGREGAALSNPLHRAVAAFKEAQAPPSSAQSDVLYGLWLFCLTRTASHELGHCFGMDHCVYYACLMQGTASVLEDYRQPPYLCPVCATKLARAAGEGSGPNFDEQQYSQQSYEAMIEVCGKWKHVSAWAGYKAWLKARSGI